MHNARGILIRSLSRSTCTPFYADYDEVSMIPGGSYLRRYRRA